MGKRIELDVAEKVWLAEECIAGRMRGREAARRAGVGSSTMHNWISRYRAEGTQALQEDGNQKKRIYSADMKQKAVEEYLSGRGSSMCIAEKYQLRSGNLVLAWVKEYHCHKDSAKETEGAMMVKRTYTLEDRVRAVKEFLEHGKSCAEIAEEYHCDSQRIRSWVKKYQELGLAGLEDRRGQRTAQQTPRTPEEKLRVQNARLERENYLLKLENDLLKKVKEWERGRD